VTILYILLILFLCRDKVVSLSLFSTFPCHITHTHTHTHTHYGSCASFRDLTWVKFPFLQGSNTRHELYEKVLRKELLAKKEDSSTIRFLSLFSLFFVSFYSIHTWMRIFPVFFLLLVFYSSSTTPCSALFLFAIFLLLVHSYIAFPFFLYTVWSPKMSF
jgi:hypothetical protein